MVLRSLTQLDRHGIGCDAFGWNLSKELLFWSGRGTLTDDATTSDGMNDFSATSDIVATIERGGEKCRSSME